MERENLRKEHNRLQLRSCHLMVTQIFLRLTG